MRSGSDLEGSIGSGQIWRIIVWKGVALSTLFVCSCESLLYYWDAQKIFKRKMNDKRDVFVYDIDCRDVKVTHVGKSFKDVVQLQVAVEDGDTPCTVTVGKCHRMVAQLDGSHPSQRQPFKHVGPMTDHANQLGCQPVTAGELMQRFQSQKRDRLMCSDGKLRFICDAIPRPSMETVWRVVFEDRKTMVPVRENQLGDGPHVLAFGDLKRTRRGTSTN